MKSEHLKNIVELNVAVLLVSTSGVLGRFISMPPPITIWMRCVLAALTIGGFIWYKKIDFTVKNKTDWKTIFLSGVFFGLHWITYFYALQLSNVAIGMLSLFTYPIITSFLEPLFFKTKLNPIHLFMGFLVLIGIYFLTPEFNLENSHTLGVLFGIISSVFYALRNILLKKKIANYNGSVLMFYQMLIIVLVLWPAFFFFEANPSKADLTALLTLALLTTAIGHTLFVMSFKNFNISSVSIMSSVQPVYGIFFGLLFLNEMPTNKTLIGGFLILLTVVIESYRSKKN